MNSWTDNDRQYSGPGRSGICRCGCSWKDHHLGMVMNNDFYEATKESYVPQECVKYGFNEFCMFFQHDGGMKYNDETKEWEEHCGGYEDELL